MQSSLTQSNAVRGHGKPFTSTTPTRSTRRAAVTRASAQNSKDHASNVAIKTVGLFAAAHVALFPGVAMADKPPPIKAATDVGEAVQAKVPEGAANPKTREERNTSRDEKLGAKVNTIKDRIDVDKIMEGANTGDLFYGNGKNKRISYNWSAPGVTDSSLQVNVNEKLSQAAGDAAANAGQKLKSATSNDPIAAAKDKASDIADAAKNATKGINTKPVSFDGSSLQVNVNEELSQAAGDAAANAGQKLKSATRNDPISAAKDKASDIADAAKNATQGIDTKPVSFSGSSLQVNVAKQGFSEEDQEEVAKIKAMNSVDPLVIEKGASKDVNKAAKEFNQSAKETVSKVLGQEPPSKPTAWSGGALQVNVDANPVEQTKAAAQEAAASVKSQTNNNPLQALKDKIDEAALTNDSPQVQLEKVWCWMVSGYQAFTSPAMYSYVKAEDKINANDKKFKQTLSPNFGGSLQHNVMFTPPAQLWTVAEQGQASLQAPQGNEGGVTQPGNEAFASGRGNPVQGGDLKDSKTNASAAQNKTSDLGLTAGQQDAAPRTAAKKQSVLPSALGGDSLVRDDSETPEDVAKGNLAKARQSSGNAVDSLKSKLGV